MPRLRHIFISLLFPILIFSQQSIIKTYTTADGMPSALIYDCVQADNGNMWFVSEQGLIEYDGSKWISHDSLDGQNPNQSFRFIKKDEQGTLWAFQQYLYESIWFLKNGVWNFLPTNIVNGHNLIGVDVVIMNGNPIILLITETSDIVLFENNVAKHLSNSLFKGLSIFGGKIIDNRILFATSKGLFYYDLLTKTIEKSYLIKNRIVYSFDIDNDRNQIYFLTDSVIGVIKESNVNAEYKVPPIQYYDRHTNSTFLKRSANGEFYYGTKFINYSFNSDLNYRQTNDQALGFATNGATSIFIDYEKNIWLTSLRGVNKINYTPFINFNTTNNFLESEVTSIEKFPNGPMIISHNNGFTVWDNNVIKTIPFQASQSGVFSRIMDMSYCASNDAVWFVSQRLGLGYISRDLNINWSVRDSPEDPTSFMCLFIDENDKKYYATSSGLFELFDSKTTKVISDIKLTVRRIYNYNFDTLILATRKGVVLYDKERKNHQVFSHSDNWKNEVYALLKIDDQNWLVGTYAGLLLFDGKQLTEFNDLTIDKPIYFINKENDYIWFGLMGGALRWNPNTGEKKLFTPNEGLSGIETNRDAFLYDDDKVYIGTNRGLSVFTESSYNADYFKVKPKINFENFSDPKGYKYNLDDTIELPSTSDDILIEFNSPSFIDEDKVEYYVEVENIDEETSDLYVSNRGDYTVRNLSFASYTISLFVKNAHGISSDTLHSSLITINPPFFLETWFIGLVILLAISASYTIYTYLMKSLYLNQLEMMVDKRTAQLKESEKNIRNLTQRIFTAQEIERQKIARDLHDNITHDMALVKLEIDKFSKPQIDSDKINYQWLTSKIGDLTNYLRNLSYFLHPDTIKQTGFANAVQSLCNEYESLTGIKLEFYSDIAENLFINEEVSTNIYRFIQEGLTNIRKHSKAKTGIVIIVTKDDNLTIRIEDDGVGFDTNEINILRQNRSMGLRSMNERILFVGGEFTIKSTKGEGTKLKAEIPLSSLSQLPSSANLDQPSES